MMLFPNCSTFDQEQTAMGMRPNSTALAEMGSHLGGRSSHVSASINQLSLLACGIVLYIAYVMSMQVCKDALHLGLFSLNISFLLFRLKCPYAWAGHSSPPWQASLCHE